MSMKKRPHIVQTDQTTVRAKFNDPSRRRKSRRERRIKMIATGIAFLMLGTLLVGFMLVVFAAVGI